MLVPIILCDVPKSHSVLDFVAVSVSDLLILLCCCILTSSSWFEPAVAVYHRHYCRIHPSLHPCVVMVARYLRELVLTDNENGLEDLPSENLGLDERDGLAVEADKTLALLAVGDGGSRLLLAEARYGRSGHDDCKNKSR